MHPHEEHLISLTKTTSPFLTMLRGGLHKDMSNICFQAALLYTSSRGQLEASVAPTLIMYPQVYMYVICTCFKFPDFEFLGLLHAKLLVNAHLLYMYI